MKRTFLGIGFGPIQTGIFLGGAFRGDFDRLVIADVDTALVQAVRDNGGMIQINSASHTAVTTETIRGIEMYNPTVEEDAARLIEAAAQADEVATALPSIAFFNYLGWLKEGFGLDPKRRRFVYAAENHNYAAEELEKTIGTFAATRYLNTVVGKMSCILPADECARRGIAALTPTADRGHLVEAFNKILIQSCEGIEDRKVQGLHDKADLLPFEEAKLYGHNAIHMWLALHAQQKGLQFMHELSGFPQLLDLARNAFVGEVGAALCKRWEGVDPLFTPEGFAAYADDLLVRMINPFLTDRVDRVCRDLERKLGWDDRLIGTLRLILREGIDPSIFSAGVAIAVKQHFGPDPVRIEQAIKMLCAKHGEEADRVGKSILDVKNCFFYARASDDELLQDNC